MTTYYVAAAGNNANNGTSSGTPWADTTNVNTTVYSGGDSVLFNGGDTITGNINLAAANWATPQQWSSSHINSDNTLSNNNLTVTHTAVAAEDAPGFAANSFTTGKYYWETVLNSGGGVGIGNTSSLVGSAGSEYLGKGADNIGYYPDGSVFNNNGLATTWGAYTAGARICHALDLTNGKYWVRVGVSGNWNNNASGDPTNSASAGNFSIPAGVIAAAVVPGFNTHVQTTDVIVAYFSSASWVGTPPAGFGSTDIGTVLPTSAVPVTFGSYGTGTATISSGSVIGFSAVNLPGVAISNLNFTGSGIASNAADGIHIENNQAGNTQISGCSIANCIITGYGKNGIWVVGQNGNSGFSTVSITGTIAHDNSGGVIGAGGGILVQSVGYLSGTPSFGTVTISNCTAYNNTGTAGGTNNTGNGILVGQGNSVTITGCLAYNNGANCSATGGGPVGIFIYDTNSYTVSFCEAHHNHTNNGHDGDGFNCDTNNGGAGLLEYCYAHDNDGFGFLFDTYAGINTVTMRYCISQNNSTANTTSEICMTNANATTLGVNLKCYNNTIYSDQPIIVIDAATSWTNITGTIANNILYAASGNKFISYGASPPTGAPTNLIFDGNNYFAAGTFSLDWNATNYASLAAWKAAFPAQEVHSGSFSTANPLLNSAGGGGTVGGYAPPQPTAYDLLIGSPEVGAGLNLNSLYSISPGTSDFYGNTIPHGVGTGYNVGAFGAAPFSDPTAAFDIVF